MGETSARRSAPPLLAVTVAVFVAVGVVLAVLLVGRAGSGGSSARLVADGSARVGQVPPQFAGTAVDGSQFDLRALRGRVVIVNFFATWCINCRAELPLLERTYRAQHGRGLEVVTVDFRDAGDARAFLAPYGITFPALLDPSSSVGHAWLVRDLPASFFVGRDGRVASVFHGQLSDITLQRSLSGLL